MPSNKNQDVFDSHVMLSSTPFLVHGSAGLYYSSCFQLLMTGGCVPGEWLQPFQASS